MDVNSLQFNYALWQLRTGSTLAQVMASCLVAPSHYLNKCWLIISKVQWHSCGSNFTPQPETPQPSITKIGLEITHLKFNWNLPRAINSLRPSDAYMHQWTNDHWFILSHPQFVNKMFCKQPMPFKSLTRASIILLSWHPKAYSPMIPSGGRFKNTYELLNLRALKISKLHKNHILQCMGKIFCVEFQRVPLKFHTKYLAHTLKDVDFIHIWKFKSS